MTEEECVDLPVHATDFDGDPVTISCWRPSPEELAEINRTGKVWLMVLGSAIPPMAVLGETPFP